MSPLFTLGYTYFTLLSIIYSSAEGGMQQQWVVYLVIYLSADIYSQMWQLAVSGSILAVSRHIFDFVV